MRAVKTNTCDLVYRGNPPDILDLDCQRIVPGRIRSFWKPSREELRLLNEGALIELDILAEPIPPVSVNIAEEGVVEVA